MVAIGGQPGEELVSDCQHWSENNLVGCVGAAGCRTCAVDFRSNLVSSWSEADRRERDAEIAHLRGQVEVLTRMFVGLKSGNTTTIVKPESDVDDRPLRNGGPNGLG
jgi:hypothetical protein